jgi:hypothetical protein
MSQTNSWQASLILTSYEPYPFLLSVSRADQYDFIFVTMSRPVSRLLGTSLAPPLNLDTRQPKPIMCLLLWNTHTSIKRAIMAKLLGDDSIVDLTSKLKGRPIDLHIRHGQDSGVSVEAMPIVDNRKEPVLARESIIGNYSTSLDRQLCNDLIEVALEKFRKNVPESRCHVFRITITSPELRDATLHDLNADLCAKDVEFQTSRGLRDSCHATTVFAASIDNCTNVC